MIKPVVLRGDDFACALEIRTPDEKKLAMKTFVTATAGPREIAFAAQG